MAKKNSAKKKAKNTPLKTKRSKTILSKQERDFLSNVGITQENWPFSRISVEKVKCIYDDYIAAQDMLLPVANSILDTLRRVPEVHSLKMRLKKPKNLVRKIVRKVKERASFKPTVSNYRRLVTDLIGIRALHLFKDEWKPIHDFIIRTWDLHERPIVYIRYGDSTDVFNGVECDIQEHDRAYRSVHCTIAMTPTKNKTTAEIQVRTLFEEGWSEIDHQVRYPSGESHPLLAQFLVIFNRLSGSADEMGSYIKVLQNTLKQQRERYDRHLEKKENELRAMIKKLQINDNERKRLQQKVNDLSKSSLASSIESVLTSHQENLLYDSSISLESLTTHGRRMCTDCFNEFSPMIASQTICPSCMLKRS